MLHVRFAFDDKCKIHPRYNPESDGPPGAKNGSCEACDDLYVIWLYVVKIAGRRAQKYEGFRTNRVRTAESAEVV